MISQIYQIFACSSLGGLERALQFLFLVKRLLQIKVTLMSVVTNFNEFNRINKIEIFNN